MIRPLTTAALAFALSLPALSLSFAQFQDGRGGMMGGGCPTMGMMGHGMMGRGGWGDGGWGRGMMGASPGWKPWSTGA